MLFEHSVAISLSKRGGVVTGVSGTMNFPQRSFRSSLDMGLNTSHRKSSVLSSTLSLGTFLTCQQGRPCQHLLGHLQAPFALPRLGV